MDVAALHVGPFTLMSSLVIVKVLSVTVWERAPRLESISFTVESVSPTRQ